jgi:hypothetical protein
MSADEIIEEILRLPEAEKEKGKRFARLDLEPGQLTGEQLGALAKRMIEASDPNEADRLEREIIRGFYGHAGPGAENPSPSVASCVNSAPRSARSRTASFD